MIGSEILFLLMLKFQRKNYHCLLKKTFLNCEMTEHCDEIP